MMLPKDMFAVDDTFVLNKYFPIYVERNNPFYNNTKTW